MLAMKISRKLVHTTNANEVRGRSYEIFLHENLSYKSFFTRKFPDLQYCVAHKPIRSLCELIIIWT